MSVLPPFPLLKVDLDYYKGHKAKLSKGAYKSLGTHAKVRAFQKHNTIPLPDFLNYFLIHRADSVDYVSYVARLKELDTATTWLKGMVGTSGTINWRPGSKGLQEWVGEAVTLSVASSMFGLIAADWDTLPIQRGPKAHPTFDFERTMVGVTAQNALIQIESKGSFVTDNTIEQKAVKTHADNIEAKKTKIASKGTAYKHPATAKYGMIAAVDRTNPAKCWILDPPPDKLQGDPGDLKVAIRLEYVASIVSLLAPFAKLPIALRERAALWREGASDKRQSLDGFPYTSENYVDAFLARKKVWLPERDVVGRLYQGEEGRIFFLGMQGDLIRAAIKQDPEAITSARFEPNIEQMEVVDMPMRVDGKRSRLYRSVIMNLYTSSSGTVIGLPDLE
ncbi:hypothetical protein KSS92_26905 [Pseudomonas atacamensis]|uniref:hypothetical protein n=1 Tax=Pseudomonas TaxID=286 RepID=UPI001C3D1CC7|nr:MULTISPECIES: hypothetical protein [Pseudomonas]QXH72903.1 hypothetical protein KSS92_26905 [Pseudomonas atacamensis]